MGCNEVTEEKAYGSDNEYDGGESDEEAQEFLGENCWVLASMNGDLMGISMDYSYGYGSIPIHTIFRGVNIHLPAILMFTRGTRF